MLLTIIIVSYNTKALTLQSVESAFQDIESSALLKNSSEVWVVDNDSSDGSIDALKTLAKKQLQLHLIFNKKNVGFASANNQAIEKSSGEYVLLLNSDTVVQAGALQRLVTTLKEAQKTPQHLGNLGVLAAQLLNPDETIQAQGGSFPNLISLATHMLLLDDLPLVGEFLPSTQHTGHNTHQRSSARLQEIEWVGGTAMMIRRDVFQEIGMLDSNIFMYGEDIEFCMRAKFHHWDIAIHPLAKVIHFGSASSSSKNAIIGELKSYLYIWAKHKPDWQQPFVKFLLRTGVMLRIVLFGTITKDRHRAALYKEALQVLKTS
jgi:N-acetylglucosaminyl-diphospho-decaprenol L-rhamnosyltransferase